MRDRIVIYYTQLVYIGMTNFTDVKMANKY